MRRGRSSRTGVGAGLAERAARLAAGPRCDALGASATLIRHWVPHVLAQWLVRRDLVGRPQGPAGRPNLSQRAGSAVPQRQRPGCRPGGLLLPPRGAALARRGGGGISGVRLAWPEI